MTEIQIIAICACALLLCFSVFNEVRRVHKGRLISRILANVLGIVCFALLLMPPTYKKQIDSKSNEMILLTEGAHADSVDQLQGNKYVLGEQSRSNPSIKQLADLSYFLKSHPEIEKLKVYGYGLPEDELKKLTGYEVDFHPSLTPNGIISASWPHQIKTGELLTVQGTYHNSEKTAIQLLLTGLGQPIDSIVIKGLSNSTFSFQVRPKLIGKALYQLLAVQKRDTIFREPVPIEVIAPLPIKVLMMASSPDFENKFLKNWLFDNRYPLAFRSRMSKDKFTTDYINIDRFNFNRINTQTLKSFDILIIDEQELAMISSDERNVIDQAVESGLGLIVQITELKTPSQLGKQFSRFENQLAKSKPLRLTLNSNGLNLTDLPTGHCLFLTVGENDQSLVTNQIGNAVVSSTLKGRGKVIHTTVLSTYPWLLSGKKNDYTVYWSELLTKGARKTADKQSFELFPQFPTVNQKARLKVSVAESGKVPFLNIDGTGLSPRQNIALPFQWDAFYWPQSTGWTTLNFNQQVESIYFYHPNDWKSFKSSKLIATNRHFSHTSKINQQKSTGTKKLVDNEVSKWWFFVGFLFAFGFLWYESKILAAK